MSLAWDRSPETDIAGYRVRYGTSSRTYSNVLDAGNQTTATISNLPVGTSYFAVTAYNTASLESQASNEVTYTVSPPNQPPVVALSSNTGPFVAPATITLTANASDPDGTVAKVEFYNGGTKLGEDLASPFSFTWNNVPAGNYSFTAVAYDNAGANVTSAALQKSVAAPNQPPVVALSSNAGPFVAPATITLNASASDPDGTVAKVEFYNGAAKVGEALASPFSFTWNNVPAGNYTFTAVAYDNAGGNVTSAALQRSVAAPNQPPVVALNSNAGPFVAPATITLNANASDPDGTVAKVEFYNGAAKLGESLASPFSFTWNNVPAGDYTLTAIATDNYGATVRSAPLQRTVGAPNQPPVVALSSSAGPFVAPASIALTANASDSDGSIAKVEFFNGGTKLGEALTSPFAFPWNNVASGTYMLTAIAYDNASAKTTSAPLELTVSPAPSSIPPSATFAYAPDGSGQVTITGQPGSTCTVSASSDMASWTVLRSATLSSSGSAVITDSAATAVSRRFYRVSDSQFTSDPSGFVKLLVDGKNRRETSTTTLFGLPLANPASYKGTVASSGPQTVTASSATWEQNQFNGVNGEFYLEITSGARAGLTADIIATQAPNQLTVGEDLSPVLLGGESFVIRKHRTIGDVFGKSNTAKLKSGATSDLADEVLVFDPVTQSFLSFYYQVGAPTGGTGWRSSDDPNTDASSVKLYLEQGLAVSRKATADLTFTLTGEVKMGPTIIPVGSGTNLVPNVYAAGTVTLANSKLYTGNGSTGITSGSGASAADEVQIDTGSKLQRYYYKTGAGWRRSGSTIDAGGTPIPVGSSVYVIRKSGRSAFNWTATQPF